MHCPSIIRGLSLLVSLWAIGASAAPDVTPPPTSVCGNLPFPAASTGSTPSTPGHWWNPKRNGTGWALAYIADNRGLHVFWYTYDASGAPVWLTSDVSQVDTISNTWAAPLYKVTWNAATNTRNTPVRAGSVAISFYPNDPTRAALTWQWDEAGPVARSECIFDFFRPGPLPGMAATLASGANSTFGGAWFEPALSGWGTYAAIGLMTAWQPSLYAEVTGVAIYDTAGQPVWLMSSDPGSATAPPMNDGFRAHSLNYTRSRFPGGFPTTDCDNCYVTVTNVGTWRRTYTSSTTGVASLSVVASPSQLAGGRAINWRRPNDGTPSVNIAKLTQPTAILVDRLQCRLSPGQQTCPVTVDWDGTSTTSAARAFRIDIATGAATLLSPNAPSGEAVDPLPDGARVRYELHAGPSAAYQLLSRTPDVRAFPGAPATPPPPDARAAPAPSATSDAVGATPGEFRVTEAGSASYSVPIFAPPGSGGVSPKLALAYDSAGGDSMLGTGWSLSGTSALSRCRRTVESGDGPGPHPPINFTATDQFCVDGQRLVLVSGAHGATGATYRTEIDSFTRFSIASSTQQTVGGAVVNLPLVFVATSKDGTVRRFGDDSRPVPQLGGSAAATNGRLTSQSGALVATLAWAQTELNDTTGNNPVVFAYEQPGGAATGEHRLQAVYYNGGRLTFRYESRASGAVDRQYAAGVAVTRSQRLSRIDVQAETSRGVMAPVRSYQLGYQVSAPNAAREHLTSVQECNGTTCYPPTTFNWAGFSTAGFQATSSATTAQYYFAGLNSFKYADVDGDGRSDVVWHDEEAGQSGVLDKIKVAYSAPGAGGIDFQPYLGSTTYTLGTGYSNDRSWYTFDFNGDGREDLLYAQYTSLADQATGQWVVLLANSTLDASTRQTTAPFETTAINPTGTNAPIGYVDSYAEGRLMDLNGDGLPDLVTAKKQGGTSSAFLSVRFLRRNPYYSPTATGSDPNRLAYVFDPTPINLQLTGMLNNCSTFTFDRYNVEHLDAVDVNGDGIADLRLREKYSSTCAALAKASPKKSRKGARVLALTASDGDTFWTVFASQGYQGGPALRFAASDATRWKSHGTGQEISDDDDKLHIQDLNGDGFSDLLYKRASANTWWFRLNRGDGTFGAETCVYAVNGACQDIKNPDLVQVLDFDGDGRPDFWWRQSDIGTADKTYSVRLWTGAGFSATPLSSQFIGEAGGDAWIRSFADIDGDGNLDNVQFRGTNLAQDSENGYGNWKAVRFADHHRPRNVILSIANGLGATTTIDYAPMTWTSLYRRDLNAPFLAYGRLSPIFDVGGPSAVVHAVTSSSPTATPAAQSPGATSKVLYRYAGLKMQGGGRGNLGFRQLLTFDPATGIETSTDYLQHFPVTGMPQVTRTRLAATPWSADACPAGQWDAPACYARPVCNSGTCDFSSLGTVLSEGRNTWHWRKSDDLSSVGVAVSALPPVPLFVYRWAATSVSFELGQDSTVAAGTLLKRTTIYTPDWDLYGNSLTSYATTLVGARVTLQTVTSTFTYDNTVNASQWLLGRLRTSSVTTSRPGQADVTRSSSFEYDPSTGLLTAERLQPGYTPDVARNTFYTFDAYGNRTKTVTCSGQVPDATCKATTAATMPFQPADRIWVQRYTRGEYDALGRFVERTYAPFSTGTAAVEVRVSAVTARDAGGNPLSTVDANGVTASATYGALGRKYFEKSSAGPWTETWYGRCGTGVACPEGAVFEQRVVPSGAPPTWTYFDVLGREMAAVRQGFSPGQSIGQRKLYDALGRVTFVSEPYLVAGPGAGAITPVAGAGVYWTSTVYDPLGRAKQVTAPNNAVTSTRYDGLAAVTILPVNGSGLTQQRKEIRNALGEIIQVQEANGHAVSYGYLATGELAAVTRAVGSENVVTSMGYDALGRKTSMTDPDMGAWRYWYDAAGEMVKQASPRAGCTQSAFDAQGRLYDRKDYAGNADTSSAACSGTMMGEAQYRFDTAAVGIGAPASDAQYQNGVFLQQRTYGYDPFGRPAQTTTQLDQRTYRHRVTYDQWGRRFQTFFQNVSDGLPEVGELYSYNSQGYLAKVQDATPSTLGFPYYDVLSMNARGQVVTEDRGYPTLSTTRTYEPATGRQTEIQTGGTSLQWLRYGYDALGNVMRREDRTGGKALAEIFGYDVMQRLSSSAVTVNGATTSTAAYTYDNGGAGPGNITAKSATGNGSAALSYFYSRKEAFCTAAEEADPGPHAASNVNGVAYCYDAAGNQTRSSDGRSITYAPFDLPTRMSHTQTNKAIGFDYGPARERVRRLDYDSAGTSGAPSLVTHYVGDTEVLRWANGTLEVRRYVSGLIRRQRRAAAGGSVDERLDYLLTDAQGSTYAVINSQGQLRDAVGGTSGSVSSFDAWGQRRDGNGWSALGNPLAFNAAGLTEHGYTGHEEVDPVGLIHMNGRIYDPKLMRFAQADPEVQSPFNGQSFNRYTYAFNNPLAFTDPTGYWGKRQQGYLRAVVAIVITVYTGGAAAGSWGFFGTTLTAGSTQAFGVAVLGGFAAGAVQSGSLKGGLQGAFSAAMFYGIGSYFQGAEWAHAGGDLQADLTAAGWAAKSLAHGVAGGVMSELQNGDFGHGFASAGVAEALNPVVDTMDNPVGKVMAAAAVGGTASVAAGGKFANGAVTAAFAEAFNDVSHQNDIYSATTYAEGSAPGEQLETGELEYDHIFSSSFEGPRIVYGAVGSGPSGLYNQAVHVYRDDGELLWLGSGSSLPTPGYVQVAPGTYDYRPGYHKGRITKGPAFWVNNNAAVPTTTVNPKHPGQGATADGIHLHWGFSANDRGSHGCFTIEPTRWNDFLKTLGKTSGTVTVP